MSKAQQIIFLTSLTALSQQVSAQLLSDAAVQTSSVNWQLCVDREFIDWFDYEPPQGLLCGYVDAPLIYSSDVQAGHVRLALTRLPAKGTKKGSVVVISGGPGSPGINPYMSNDSAVDRLKETYDIIGYDPRGVGKSTPKISCESSDSDQILLPDEDYIAKSEDETRKTIATCIEKTGAQILRHIGTHEAVNDLNVIRSALGEPALTAVAYSYGTMVATLYAERFPEYTRALVLDGVVDLSEDDYTQRLNQARSYQQTFQRFAAECAKKSNCPLPGDESQAVKAFHQILRKVNDSPLITQNGDEISVYNVLEYVDTLLSLPDRWSDLATLLSKINASNADKQVVDLMGLDEPGSDTSDIRNVILCADVAVPGTDTQVLRRRLQEISAAESYRNFQGTQESPLGMCDLWPFHGTFQAHIPVVSSSLPPLLFVGQRYDAPTPYVNAKQMAKWFRSPLITRESDGHTIVFNGIDLCVDEAVVDYLLAPREGAREKTCR